MKRSNCPFCGATVTVQNKNPVGNDIIKFFYCDDWQNCGAIMSFQSEKIDTTALFERRVVTA